MRQRAVIAMALSCDPDVIIADEPTTALDAIMQDRILRELKAIQNETELAVIYISHDIAVIAEVTDSVAVMYAGRLVEMGSTAEVLASPLHHYTAALVSSFPNVNGDKRPLAVLGGEPPDLVTPPAGCPLHPRCPAVTEVCRTEAPPRVNRETNGQPAGILRVIGWLQRGQRRDRTGLIHAAVDGAWAARCPADRGPRPYQEICRIQEPVQETVELHSRGGLINDN